MFAPVGAPIDIVSCYVVKSIIKRTADTTCGSGCNTNGGRDQQSAGVSSVVHLYRTGYGPLAGLRTTIFGSDSLAPLFMRMVRLVGFTNGSCRMRYGVET